MGEKGRAIVIGAGIAGLTAGHFLKEAGYEVILVEQDSRPGGRIMSVRKDDDIIDVGAQFIHTNYKLTLELCKKFNLDSELVDMKNDDMIMRGDRPHIIPWGGVRIPAISLWSQLKMVRLFGPMIRRRKSMALERWHDLLDLDKIELSTFARLKLNEEILHYVVRPFMLTYSMSEPEGISVAYFMRSLYMYVTTGACCLKSGNDTLPKAMAKDLDIRYGTTVTEILLDNNGSIGGVQTSGGSIEASAVISAVPSPALLPLSPSWNKEQAEFLREFTYSKLPIAVLEGPVGDEVTFWGAVLDRQAGHRVAFITFPHMKYADACKSRYALAWLMGAFGEELIDQADEKIIDAMTNELSKAGPVDPKGVEPTSVVRHLHTYPQYRVGMFEKLLRFKQSEGKPAGLYFAGDYTEGGLIEGAAQSGRKAAERLIKRNS